MDKKELLNVASNITTVPDKLAGIYNNGSSDREIVEAVGLNPQTPLETLKSIFINIRTNIA